MTQAAEEPVLHILWMNGGLGCDGDSVALTAATQPSIEEIVLGALPGLPKVAVHWPLIDFECGPEQGADTFIEWWHKADRGELDPFVLVVEGSIPNEAIKSEGYWCGFGNNPATGQPMTTSEWLDRLAPKATAILAVGTCATYGGIHAMGATRPAPWACRTTSAGAGSPRPACRSSACRAARSTWTTCPRRSCTCSTRWPGRRR
jgi:hydrogenase small subunit